MKIKPVNYTHGGLSLEIVGETPVEAALLREIFKHGSMSMGNGNSSNGDGTSTGFYLRMSKGEARAGGN
jgi:hypothetical protein